MEEIYENLNQEKLDSLDRIINKYGYQSYRTLIRKYINHMVRVNYSSLDILNSRINKLELANLIKFLQNSLGKEIKLTSGLGKFKRKVTLSNKSNLYFLFLSASTILQHMRGEQKEKIDTTEDNNIFSILNNPYTRKELGKIIDYEKDNIKNSLSYYELLGLRAIEFQYHFNNEEVIQDKGRMFKNIWYKGEGISAELAFIYDCLVLTEEIIPADDYDIEETTTHEKYTFIKYCLKAYYNFTAK